MRSKLLSILFICALLIGIMPLGANALDDPEVLYSGNCAVYNIENNKFCYSRSADEHIAPAGTVKIMTGVLAIEYYEGRYDSVITIEQSWLSPVTGLTAKFTAGEQVTAEMVISGLIVGSGNDAAYILANAISGSTEAFVEMMNKKAGELGMNDTHYTNPTGTDDEGMYTSVNDVVKISSYAYSLGKYTEISDSPSVVMDVTNLSGARTIYSRNYFVSNYYNTRYLAKSVMGLNTGFSGNAGWCLSVIGRSDSGLTYIVVVMNARDPEPEEGEELEEFFVSGYEDARVLLDWAYNNFGYFTILDTSTMVCEVPVKLSNKVDHVTLLPEEKIVSFLPLDTDIETAVRKEWKLNQKTVKAPLSQGQVIGEMTVYIEDEEIGRVNLIARNNVDRDNWLLILDTVLSFLTHPAVIVIGIVILLLIVLYTVLQARRLAKKRRIVRYKDPR